MSNLPDTEIFALLDDASATSYQPSSRLYSNHVRTIACWTLEELPTTITLMEQAIASGLCAIGLFCYELGMHIHGIRSNVIDEPKQPLIQILLFSECVRLNAEEVDQWLQKNESQVLQTSGNSTTFAGAINFIANTNRDKFIRAVEEIQAFINAGDVYQVNYTYQLNFETFGNLFTLYRLLRQRQPVPYGSLIALPNGQSILSFSPELFVSHLDGLLTAQPMKGTAPASNNADIDAENAARLSADKKNRAENLMIVDLLRNDLGQIATIGSVNAASLFDVKTYGNVLQMTSTIHAKLKPETSLTNMLTALFPCGSITGAPKRRSMEIIQQLEARQRGLYTGAIGWFDQPSNQRMPCNFLLSVPIRTLFLKPPSPDNIRLGSLGVGAGIVHDSCPAQEYLECQLKASFLVDAPIGFSLFETLYATRENGYRYLAQHLERLKCSAQYFNFRFELDKIQDYLNQNHQTLAPLQEFRVKLTLSKDGDCTVENWSLQTQTLPVRLLLSSEPIMQEKQFLTHKTTMRHQYDQAWKYAESNNAFDMIFFNQEGELTEGARSNIFLRLDNAWYTPPITAGVLPGITRKQLLADCQWAASEKSLSINDLRSADKIIVCNALRGVMDATIADLDS